MSDMGENVGLVRRPSRRWRVAAVLGCGALAAGGLIGATSGGKHKAVDVAAGESDGAAFAEAIRPGDSVTSNGSAEADEAAVGETHPTRGPSPDASSSNSSSTQTSATSPSTSTTSTTQETSTTTTTLCTGPGFKEFPVTAAATGGLAAGPDGAIWYPALPPPRPMNATYDMSLGAIYPDGSQRSVVVSNVSAHTIVPLVSPDGTRWALVYSGPEPKLSLVDRDGTFNEFSLPHFEPPAVVLGVTAGSDGNVWYTIVDGPDGFVVRLTRDGTATKFPVPNQGWSSNHWLGRPVVGSDGAIWFLKGDGVGPSRRLGRITPAGEVSSFPLPDHGEYMNNLASGPDGNLWYSFGRSGVGRFTLATHEVDETKVDAWVTSLTAGPDGHLWSVDGLTHDLLRLSPDGSVTRVVTPGEPFDSLTLGADGGLWFQDRNTHRISVYRLSGMPCA